MRECLCEVPQEAVDPRREGTCERCSRPISKRWTSNDETLAAFLDRLAHSIPGQGNPSTRSPAFEQFRLHVEARELAGRPRFGQSFLGRDNLAEAREEAVDLALYACLDALRAVRDGRADEDSDLVLTMAYHAYRAYESSLGLRDKRHGAPAGSLTGTALRW